MRPQATAPSASCVLLIVAMAAERSALRSILQNPHDGHLESRPAVRGQVAGRDVLLVQAGIGRQRVRATLMAAVRAVAVRGVWSLGFAGGLHDALRPGDLVCPGCIIDEGDTSGASLTSHGHESVAAAMRGAGLSVESGPLITVTVPVSQPDAKRTLGRRTGAIAVDMEAAEVVRAAGDLGLPWMALKAVLDPVDEPLPPALARCATPSGDVRWRGLGAALLDGPTCWRALFRLGRASCTAAHTLACGLDAAFGTWACLDAAVTVRYDGMPEQSG